MVSFRVSFAEFFQFQPPFPPAAPSSFPFTPLVPHALYYVISPPFFLSLSLSSFRLHSGLLLIRLMIFRLFLPFLLTFVTFFSFLFLSFLLVFFLFFSFWKAIKNWCRSRCPRGFFFFHEMNFSWTPPSIPRIDFSLLSKNPYNNKFSWQKKKKKKRRTIPPALRLYWFLSRHVFSPIFRRFSSVFLFLETEETENEVTFVKKRKKKGKKKKKKSDKKKIRETKESWNLLARHPFPRIFFFLFFLFFYFFYSFEQPAWNSSKREARWFLNKFLHSPFLSSREGEGVRAAGRAG